MIDGALDVKDGGQGSAILTGCSVGQWEEVRDSVSFFFFSAFLNVVTTSSVSNEPNE
jgi:hypothetical protein